MDLQVIKIDLLDEAVPCEPGLIVELKVFYIGIQPDGLAQVKFAADLIQSLKDHGSAGHGVVPVGGHGDPGADDCPSRAFPTYGT